MCEIYADIQGKLVANYFRHLAYRDWQGAIGEGKSLPPFEKKSLTLWEKFTHRDFTIRPNPPQI
jgi:hypothetical protein